MTTLHFIPWFKVQIDNRDCGPSLWFIRDWPDTKVESFAEVLLMLLNNDRDQFDPDIAELLRGYYRTWRRKYE